MNETSIIKDFLKNIANDDFSKANKNIKQLVEHKLQKRIKKSVDVKKPKKNIVKKKAVKKKLNESVIHTDQIKKYIVFTKTPEGEIRVSYRKEIVPSEERREAMAYYATDREEAIATAKTMVETFLKNPEGHQTGKY